MTNKPKSTLSKVFNISFYVVLGILTVYFLKNKFVVPALNTEQLTLQTYQNQNIDFDTYKGKVLVINFWQTWCAPCISEMPDLNDMSNQWEDIVVLAVSDEPISKIQTFVNKYKNIHFVSINDMKDAGITQFPTTYILNKKGVRVYSKIGAKNWADKNFISTLKKNWADE